MTSVTSSVTLSPTISLAAQRRIASAPQNSRWTSLTSASSAKVATIASSSNALTAAMYSATIPRGAGVVGGGGEAHGSVFLCGSSCRRGGDDLKNCGLRAALGVLETDLSAMTKGAS